MEEVTKEEIMEVLTMVMRGGGSGALRAAELLGKIRGLFEPQQEERPAPRIITLSNLDNNEISCTPPSD